MHLLLRTRPNAAAKQWSNQRQVEIPKASLDVHGCRRQLATGGREKKESGTRVPRGPTVDDIWPWRPSLPHLAIVPAPFDHTNACLKPVRPSPAACCLGHLRVACIPEANRPNPGHSEAFIHAFIHSFIHPCIHSFIHSFVHSFTHAIPFCFISFHCISYHGDFISFHSSSFHFSSSHAISFHFMASHSIPSCLMPFMLYSSPFHSSACHSILFHSILFHSISLHGISFHFPFNLVSCRSIFSSILFFRPVHSISSHLIH